MAGMRGTCSATTDAGTKHFLGLHAQRDLLTVCEPVFKLIVWLQIKRTGDFLVQ